ncbi:MAG: hypothetical protein UT40_C0025G0010 [Candidatus Woesebacteria bacterium GW2011_GWA1_39_21b]|uniref:Uncharacterized protein n=2 Tax=Patescibacteria group TaxID=1783273 RepID=A0A1G2QFH3_9BACT|nr:MAG: hypothetical protein US72_C0021G0009 [Microgenomates group bacterium GW2011_GWC1_38_12]KKR13095.1 MAG: hypothetical protein UT40_C0025G0010 [Candidatus Woesebacteria bacterium GW2011_GWA1_39_21b]OHA58721.1 MAG: hypothetical protein A2370_02455 [Candidatus Vogelbacteria bacterium RIFOXYB1_FULL_42_16]
MINLLPAGQKIKISNDYHNRRATAVGLLTMVVIFSGLVLLGAFYFSALIGLGASVGQEAVKNREESRGQYEHQLSELRQNLTLLKGLTSNNFSVEAIFEKLAKTKMAGIKIKALQYSLDDKGQVALKMQITATTRKIAVEYISNLKKMEEIADVVHPILIEAKNLSIPLELVLKK